MERGKLQYLIAKLVLYDRLDSNHHHEGLGLGLRLSDVSWYIGSLQPVG